MAAVVPVDRPQLVVEHVDAVEKADAFGQPTRLGDVHEHGIGLGNVFPVRRFIAAGNPLLPGTELSRRVVLIRLQKMEVSEQT